MRGADGGPWRRLCALPAFWVGLLYDERGAGRRLGPGQGLDRGGARGHAPRRAPAGAEGAGGIAHGARRGDRAAGARARRPRAAQAPQRARPRRVGLPRRAGRNRPIGHDRGRRPAGRARRRTATCTGSIATTRIEPMRTGEGSRADDPHASQPAAAWSPRRTIWPARRAFGVARGRHRHRGDGGGAATLLVVYPQMLSIGGDAFWLVAAGADDPIAVEACGAAGSRSRPRSLCRAQGNSLRGALAANAVAGAMSGWIGALEVSRRWGGRLPVARLLEEAMLSRRGGVPVSENQADIGGRDPAPS